MEKWVNINVTLKCWLVFMIGFALSGYAVEFAILLGALAGITGGFIASWWQAKGDEEGNQPDAEQLIGTVKRVKEKIEGKLGFKDDKTTRSSKRPRMGFFGVRDPKKSRRR